MSDFLEIAGAKAVLITAGIICAISWIVCFAILYEFVHIHRKRMALLLALDKPTARHSILERIVLLCAYGGSTIIMTLVALGFFFYHLA